MPNDVVTWLWVDDHPPTEVGWYATTVCWDIAEGIFPSAHYWNGAEWNGASPISSRSPQMFATEALASTWADEHDPEK